MCQIPSPSCDTKNQGKGPTEDQADQVTNSPECRSPRLIFELVNVLIRSLEVELGPSMEIKTPKGKVWMDLVSSTWGFDMRVLVFMKNCTKMRCYDLWISSPHFLKKKKRWLGRHGFPVSLSCFVQIVKIMQITILAPLLEENIIKLCSKYFVCFSNYSHVTVNKNSCYSV